jgi:hypothetical protein
MSRKGTSQPRKNIVALGNMGYRNATSGIMAAIGKLAHSVKVWDRVIERLGEFVEGEDEDVTNMRNSSQLEVEKATKRIDRLNKLHKKVTKRRTNPDQRIIGSVLHVEPIVVVADGPNQFTRDWALIELLPRQDRMEYLHWKQGLHRYVSHLSCLPWPVSFRSFSFS